MGRNGVFLGCFGVDQVVFCGELFGVLDGMWDGVCDVDKLLITCGELVEKLLVDCLQIVEKLLRNCCFSVEKLFIGCGKVVEKWFDSCQ